MVFLLLSGQPEMAVPREILRLKKQKPPQGGGEMQFSTGVSIPLLPYCKLVYMCRQINGLRPRWLEEAGWIGNRNRRLKKAGRRRGCGGGRRPRRRTRAGDRGDRRPVFFGGWWDWLR